MELRPSWCGAASEKLYRPKNYQAMPDNKTKDSEIGTGEETVVEQLVSNYLATGIHMFLSAVALLLVIAAVIATYDTVVRAFPLLWQPHDEYAALQKIVENLLLIAI